MAFDVIAIFSQPHPQNYGISMAQSKSKQLLNISSEKKNSFFFQLARQLHNVSLQS